MYQEQLWQEIIALPPSVQQQDVDYIAFLRRRYVENEVTTPESKPNLREELFVGIGDNRLDMSNSTDWVKDTRQREWG